MKTAEEWVCQRSSGGPFDGISSMEEAVELVKDIQKDAVTHFEKIIMEGNSAVRPWLVPEEKPRAENRECPFGMEALYFPKVEETMTATKCAERWKTFWAIEAEESSVPHSCPYCNSHKVSLVNPKEESAYYVKCDSCNAKGPEIPSSRRLAIRMWNNVRNIKEKHMTEQEEPTRTTNYWNFTYCVKGSCCKSSAIIILEGETIIEGANRIAEYLGVHVRCISSISAG